MILAIFRLRHATAASRCSRWPSSRSSPRDRPGLSTPQAFACPLAWVRYIVSASWSRRGLTEDPWAEVVRWLRGYLTRGLDTIGPPAEARARDGIAALVVFTAIVVSHSHAVRGVIGALSSTWSAHAGSSLRPSRSRSPIPRYSLIANQYGGIFSGFDILPNASSVGVKASAAQAFTADAVRLLAVGTWLSTAMSCWARRSAGRVILPALLGGDAVRGGRRPVIRRRGDLPRVPLLPAPWCSLLLADAIYRWRSQARRFVVTLVVMTKRPSCSRSRGSTDPSPSTPQPRPRSRAGCGSMRTHGPARS